MICNNDVSYIKTCEVLFKLFFKITDERDENLNLETLQKFSWAGKWNEVNKYLKPFHLYIGDFINNCINCFILKMLSF